MRKLTVVALGCCLLIAAVAIGQIKRVKVKREGKPPQVFKGIVTETRDGYQIETTAGPVVIIAKDKVLSIEDVVTLEDVYKQRLAKIDPKNPRDHFDLGDWALENNLLEIAQKELETALELKPDYEMAALLLRQVAAKLRARQPTTRPFVRPIRGFPAGPAGAGGIDPSWILTDEEISRIRLEELRENDRVVVAFRRDVVNRFIESMQGSGDFAEREFINTFRRWSPVRKARYILGNIDRNSVSIKDDIIIKSDPRFMIDFRRRVWPTISARCASVDCHGRPTPLGDFALFNIPATNQRIEYTNFLILDRYSKGGRKMIDRDHVGQSLLLQYGLPPAQSQFPHPVDIRTPAYASRTTVDYRRVSEWLESLKGPLHPEYRVILRVPWAPKGGRVSIPDLDSAAGDEGAGPTSQPTETIPWR